MMLLNPIRKASEYIRTMALYMGSDYLTAYARHTNRRVGEDPQAAIGGCWEEIGQLQFDFLVQQGLLPTDTMLDIGCGTLRGGQYFIRYLKPGRYVGTDISSGVLEAGASLIDESELRDKRARLILTNGDLKFDQFPGESFDFILAQSVFTHLPIAYIDECFQNIRKVMTRMTRFFFTWNNAPKARRTDFKTFEYPFEDFVVLARRYGYSLKDVSVDYPHPRGQRMAEMTL